MADREEEDWRLQRRRQFSAPFVRTTPSENLTVVVVVVVVVASASVVAATDTLARRRRDPPSLQSDAPLRGM